MTLFIRPADSFARPANTTQYTAADLVAHDVDAADVNSAPSLVFDMAPLRQNGGKIVGGILEKSSNTVTVATFRLHIYDRIKTVTNGDNGALVISDNLGYICSLAFDMATAANNVALSGTAIQRIATALAQPGVFTARRRQLYGYLEATGAYAPASGEVFTATLFCES